MNHQLFKNLLPVTLFVETKAYATFNSINY